jgi:hypothetical protein
VIRQIEIIGEAVKRLSPALTAAEGTVPWRLIAGARDRLIYGYAANDKTEVAQTMHEGPRIGLVRVRAEHVGQRRVVAHECDTRRLLGALRQGGQRRTQRAHRRHANECSAVRHWITSSACNSSDRGIVTPNAWAVF